jgi:hypothetical protein
MFSAAQGLASLVALFSVLPLPLLADDAESGRDAPNVCEPGQIDIELDLGNEYYGSLNPVDDQADVYEFQATQAGTYGIRMKPAPLLPGNLPTPDYDLALFDDACVPGPTSENLGAQEETIVVFLSPGLYHVKVLDTLLVTHPRVYADWMCHPFCLGPDGYNITVRIPP